MSKYSKMAKVERKLPIIFMINEKMLSSEKWYGGTFKAAIKDIMANLSHRSIDAVMSVVSFGDEVHLWSEFKSYGKYTEKEWPTQKTSGKAVFHIALTLVKDMIEDIDTTPEGNYDPVVILISSDEVSPGYKNALKMFEKDGRFNNIQKIGIADLSYDGSSSYYASHSYGCDYKAEVNRRAPKILKEFSGENVVLYIDDIKYESWCASFGWNKLETKEDYTWFCPVLNMMELRYTEDGQQYTCPICEGEGRRTTVTSDVENVLSTMFSNLP